MCCSELANKRGGNSEGRAFLKTASSRLKHMCNGSTILLTPRIRWNNTPDKKGLRQRRRRKIAKLLCYRCDCTVLPSHGVELCATLDVTLQDRAQRPNEDKVTTLADALQTKTTCRGRLQVEREPSSEPSLHWLECSASRSASALRRYAKSH